MNLEKKPTLLETSKTLTMIILFAVIIGTSAIFYYDWYSDYDNRKKDVENSTFVGKGKILEINPIQNLSMHFDGNNILDLGRQITFQYQIDSKIIKATERIEKTELDGKYWKTLMEFEIGDTIYVGVLQNGKSLVLFDKK